ncbi:MAG TPA: DUF5131 family protein, partial [Gemmatimonadaceae bacterium]|nr:DUF5131 family protein [Gemmatimonadaceae bacterium]
GIEWCDHTFNIAWGCMKVSPGCAHCYADTLSSRYGFDVWGPASTTGRRTFGEKYWSQPLRWDRLAERRGRRERVFCGSMMDVFEGLREQRPHLARLFELIRQTPHLDWLLLTKRPERIADRLPTGWYMDGGWPNVWLGTSVESDEYRDRLADLLKIPARVRFLSAEPLLAPLTLGEYADDLDWCIVGGESGPSARPMALEWADSLRRECEAARVAFFLKQLGGHPNKRGHEDAVLDGVRYLYWPVAA